MILQERTASASAAPGLVPPTRLGSVWDGKGTTFALRSRHAEGVDVCLFGDGDGRRQRERVPLVRETEDVWRVHVPGVGPGHLYGHRVRGPYLPERGLRFNPAKLLIDPYARALAGGVDWSAPVHGYRLGAKNGDQTPDPRDSSAGVPRSVVVDPGFDWGDDRPPATPWTETVVYELHVKGFTRCHPEIPEAWRGTYRGLAHPAAIAHLRGLGVTAVELLPVHAFVDDGFLVRRGLRNFWGYSSLGFFAPEARYAAGGDRGQQVSEFKSMIKALHAAGIEVILDVVYNHTCEGNNLGPTLAFRGLDNASYYRLDPGQPRLYQDFTGTGNTVDTRKPGTLQLVVDSLRYWVDEMHVDGFRFDLASALARGTDGFERDSAFLVTIREDPVLSRVKLIAEPWDTGAGGYQVGNYPFPWREWNDRYRDAVRTFWRSDRHAPAEMGYRLSGSSDLFADLDRAPCASINYVTCHDGFTLEDLVSYEQKHNLANGEGNRDGSDHNRSSNNGVEGPTTDPAIRARRDRQKRNMLATLLLSPGVPMLLAGDELGRSQGGNNNVYCQDNAVSWLDWRPEAVDHDLLDFTKRVLDLRRRHSVLRRRSFFEGRPLERAEIKDLTWLRPDGQEMTHADWHDPHLGAFGFRLAGDEDNEPDAGGGSNDGSILLILLNSGEIDVPFRLPAIHGGDGAAWHVLLDTARPELETGNAGNCGEFFPLQPRSLVLCCQRGDPFDSDR